MRKNMNLSIILALFVLLIFIPASYAHNADTDRIVTVLGDMVWLHTAEGLIVTDAEGNRIAEPQYSNADCYAVDTDGCIYYSEGGTIYKTDALGTMIDQWNTEFPYFTKLVINGEYLIGCYGEEVGSLNMKERTMKGASIKGLVDVAPYNDTSFVVYLHDYMGLLGVLDCATMDEIKVSDVRDVRSGICKGSEDDGIYLFKDNVIYHAPQIGEDLHSYAQIPCEYAVHDVALEGNKVYVVHDNGFSVYSLEETVIKEHIVLGIVDASVYEDDPRFENTIEIFMQRHPECTFDFFDVRDARNLAAALLANDPGYDLLCINANAIDEIQAGIVMPLNDNSVIMENLDQYWDMPFLPESDGNIYCIPVNITPMGYLIRESKQEAFGIEVNPEWTWEDFYALGQVAQDNGLYLCWSNYHFGDMLYQYESMYCDLLQGKADFNTETYAKLVTIWKNLFAEGKIMTVDELYTLGQDVTLLEFSGMGFYPGLKRIQLDMPLIDGKRVTPILITGLYANANSENYDLVVEFLEIFSSVEVQTMQSGISSGMLLDDFTQYYDYEEYVAQKGLPTAEELNRWREFMDTGRQAQLDGALRVAIGEINKRLIDGKITMEEYLIEVDERAQLYVGE